MTPEARVEAIKKSINKLHSNKAALESIARYIALRQMDAQMAELWRKNLLAQADSDLFRRMSGVYQEKKCASL